jgi:putative radical SAM enzyme (TIGR03279 family)
LLIKRISPGSPASRAGLRAGDSILRCEGSAVSDWLDFCLHAAGSAIRIEYGRSAVQRHVRLTRDPCVPWGMEFFGQEPDRCRNRCIFCFVDQQPPGLRLSLMVKDDDVRYSFFQGTYITLDPVQAEQAITRRLSPIHVSVHATDPDLRGRLLGHRDPAPILPVLDELARHGIEVEAQVVLIPGLNDGKMLEETAGALYHTGNVTALGIVPVGLTDWRDGLPPLRRPDPGESEQILQFCDAFRERALEERGKGWIYAADELYLQAGREIPPVSYYLGSALESNGIGLLSRTIEENRGKVRLGEGTVCTASLSYRYVSSLLEGSSYDVLLVENALFGSMVGVAGLLGGGDIVRQLSGSQYGMPVFLPGIMFNHDMYTLDGMTPEDLERETGMSIAVLDRLSQLP